MTGEITRDEAIGGWELEGRSEVVEYPLALLEELIESAMAGFRSAPWGGPEVGGVLFGTREEDRVRILTHRTIDCEHAGGPAFELSGRDQEGLCQLLRESVGGLQAVGWYHSRYRDSSIPDSSVAIFDRHFPEPWQVTLILGRDQGKPCQVEVFSRRRNGTLQSMRPKLKADPKPELAPEPVPEPVPASVPEPVPEPVPELVPEPEPPPPAPPPVVDCALTEPLFPADSWPRAVYWSPQHKQALAELCYGVRDRRGLMVLTGEAGTGKTTLLRCLGEYLVRESIEFAFLLNSRISAAQFYEMLAYDLAFDCPRAPKPEVLATLNRLMQAQAARGRTTALIVDEAHNLERDVLEEIQLLDNLASRKDRLLQIVLAGQPALERNLEAESLGPLRQQTATRCSLRAFTEEETRSCIAHYLVNAGMTEHDIFPPELTGEIHRRCRGIAGTIKLVCDHLLKICSTENSRVATLEMLDRARKDLHPAPHAASTQR